MSDEVQKRVEEFNTKFGPDLEFKKIKLDMVKVLTLKGSDVRVEFRNTSQAIDIVNLIEACMNEEAQRHVQN